MPRKSKVTLYEKDPVEPILEENEADTLEYLDRVKRIKAEEKRLRALFKDIAPDKYNLVLSTISDVAFMTITMDELREKINKNGTVDRYQNGATQWGTKQSPDAQLYLQFSQKLAQGMKILLDCLPKNEKGAEVADEMDLRAFVKRK